MAYTARYLVVRMPKNILTLLAALVASKPVWLTNYGAALTQAAATSKIILANFTGSDWCVHCQNLKSQVFETATFSAWAKKVVLLEVDFPQYKQLPPELKTQNYQLEDKYDVGGARPTVIGLNADGTERGRLVGYTAGLGPQAWISQFESVTQLNQSSSP